MGDAVADMIFQHGLLHTAERGPDGCDLRYHIDAIAVLLDHASEAPDLAFDFAETFEDICLGVHLHA